MCTDRPWIDNFITIDGGQFVVWDEVQANELKRFDCYDDAIEFIYEYANFLEKDM